MPRKRSGSKRVRNDATAGVAGGDENNVVFKLCKDVTYFTPPGTNSIQKLVKLGKSNNNPTTYYPKEYVYTYYGDTFELDEFRDFVYNNMSESDKTKYSEDYSLLLVNQNDTDKVNARAKKDSITAVMMCPTIEITESLKSEEVQGGPFLFCFVKKDETTAHKCSKAGSFATPENILGTVKVRFIAEQKSSKDNGFICATLLRKS